MKIIKTVVVEQSVLKPEQTSPKPFEPGEVVAFPCGGFFKVKFWGEGGVCIELDTNNHEPTIQFVVGAEALKALPKLAERALATIKSF